MAQIRRINEKASFDGRQVGEQSSPPPFSAPRKPPAMTEERNYVAEAFRIAAGESMLLPEREHLRAMIELYRKHVDVLLRTGKFEDTVIDAKEQL